MKKIYVKKGEILQHAGERNTKVYHVESGLLRSYSMDQKGKEHIFMFAPEGWVVGDNNPPEVPCDLIIDAMEDAVVIVLEKDIEREHQNAKPLIKRLAVLQKRILLLMSASAIERYEHFVDTYPDIIQRVPQKMVASYLGITPEALSKVKNQKTRGLKPNL